KQRENSKTLKAIIKEWLILTIFYTKPLMGNPYFSTSPRDLWSNQWHQVYHQVFQELGYLPVKNYFKRNQTLGRALGICAAFLIILWEVVEGDILGRGKDFKDSFGIK
ncbi:231_t:CDS:2, partial [Racocetra persica]